MDVVSVCPCILSCVFREFLRFSFHEFSSCFSRTFLKSCFQECFKNVSEAWIFKFPLTYPHAHAHTNAHRHAHTETQPLPPRSLTSPMLQPLLETPHNSIHKTPEHNFQQRPTRHRNTTHKYPTHLTQQPQLGQQMQHKHEQKPSTNQKLHPLQNKGVPLEKHDWTKTSLVCACVCVCVCVCMCVWIC